MQVMRAAGAARGEPGQRALAGARASVNADRSRGLPDPRGQAELRPRSGHGAWLLERGLDRRGSVPGGQGAAVADAIAAPLPGSKKMDKLLAAERLDEVHRGGLVSGALKG
jgi:hypothetical protein